MTIREGKWRCTYCGEVCRGRDLKCVACGAIRDKDVQFIYDEEAAEVTDEQQLQQARAGAEWICETCGTSNPNPRGSCKQCSAPRGASAERRVGMYQPAQPEPPPPARRSNTLVKVMIAIAASVLLFGSCGILGLYLMLRTHEERLTVNSVFWERTAEVEQLQTLTKSDWEDQVPQDARIESRSREFHHNEKVQTGTRRVEKQYTEKVQTGTKRVKVGTKDLGNGYFEDIYEDQPVYENKTRTKTVDEPVYRDEPVYKYKVRYKIDRWVAVRAEKSSGSNNSPEWPKVNEDGRVRVGKKTGKYLVNFTSDKGKNYAHEVKEEEFAQYTPGRVFKAKINSFGISELRPE